MGPKTEDESFALRFENFPAKGVSTQIRTVALGPTSDKVVILIEADDEELHVTVGNGPANMDAPLVVAEMLRSIATTLEDEGFVSQYNESIADSLFESTFPLVEGPLG